jgi:hypothetical protein
MDVKVINITASLLARLWSAYTEFMLKKQELDKYLEEVTSYWMQSNSKRQKAEKEIAKAKQYVKKELAVAEKRYIKKDMAAERLAEKQMKAAKAKLMRLTTEEDINLGVFGEYLSFHSNNSRIQRHHQTISNTEYERTEKRREAKSNKFAMYKLDDKSRKTERKNSRNLKYSSETFI